MWIKKVQTASGVTLLSLKVRYFLCRNFGKARGLTLVEMEKSECTLSTWKNEHSLALRNVDTWLVTSYGNNLRRERCLGRCSLLVVYRALYGTSNYCILVSYISPCQGQLDYAVVQRAQRVKRPQTVISGLSFVQQLNHRPALSEVHTDSRVTVLQLIVIITVTLIFNRRHERSYKRAV